MILEGYTIAADLIAALVGAKDLFPYRVLHPTPYLISLLNLAPPMIRTHTILCSGISVEVRAQRL